MIIISCCDLVLLRFGCPLFSGEENKNPNNLKVTVLKQVSKNLLPDKFSENPFQQVALKNVFR